MSRTCTRCASVPHGSSYQVLMGLGRTSHGDTSKSQSTGEGVNLKEGDEPGGPRSGRRQRQAVQREGESMARPRNPSTPAGQLPLRGRAVGSWGSRRAGPCVHSFL